jgi:signal transduction histidine kinase
MEIVLNSYSIPIWLVSIFIGAMATVIYWGSSKIVSKIFAFSIYIVTIYTISVAFFLFQEDFKLSAFGIRLTFFIGVLIACSIYYFIRALYADSRPNHSILFWLLSLSGISFYLFFYTPFIISDTVPYDGGIGNIFWVWKYGKYSYLFLLIILPLYISGFRYLFKTYKIHKDTKSKMLVVFIMVGLLIGFLSQLILNTILPYIGNFNFVQIAPLSNFVWVSLLAYAIIRYNAMSIRLVITEILVIAVAVTTFTNIFIGDLMGQVGKTIIFIAFIILGLFLIRTSIRESEQREQLSNLNEYLQNKIDEQTKEIRTSYEVERNARLELEKIDTAKNQFMLITQHHLRTPITSLKWQLEAIADGTFGNVNMEVKKALGDANESVDRLNHLINSLLSISALRAGVETLKRAPTNVKDILDDVVNELKKDIERKHIIVDMPGTKEKWPNVNLDREKMKEVLFIIVENAVRYNIENGTVSITVYPTENHIEIIVENTGAEITDEEKKKVFSELFYRSSNAQVSNPTGMGIGLSMAQAIIEAHKGNISFSSRKSGGGAKVVVKLPY